MKMLCQELLAHEPQASGLDPKANRMQVRVTRGVAFRDGQCYQEEWRVDQPLLLAPDERRQTRLD